MMVVNDTTGRIHSLGKELIFYRHILILIRKYLQIEELDNNNQEHPPENETYDITARLIEDRHLRILSLNYTVFVLNFSFLKNKSSVNRTSIMLIPVVAITFPTK